MTNYRRVVVQQNGGPEQMHLVVEPLPEPQAGEVRVKVLAAGVAFADVMIREGKYPGAPAAPVTPGYDFIGQVDALGPDVGLVDVGQLVAALTVHGSYADYRTIAASDLVPLPTGLDPVPAAALPLNYVTAHQMLHRIAQVPENGSILIHGAAGGVGTALMQLGKRHGLTMYGTASAGKHDLLREHGVQPIDYRSEDFAARVREQHSDGLDAVFDNVGGPEHLRRSYSVLKSSGWLVVYGFGGTFKEGRFAGGALAVPLSMLTFGVLALLPGKQASFYSVANLKTQQPDWYRTDLLALFDLLNNGEISPIIGRTLPLTEARQAHELLGQAAVSGKIVLVPAPTDEHTAQGA